LSGTALISTAIRFPPVESKGSPAVLGRDDGGELATANVADKPLGGRIDPTDDSRRVEDVARDADVAKSLLDVAAD
jgi:hypothetical protein